jgi:hypothetical protein
MRPVEVHASYQKAVDLGPIREEARVAVKTALGSGRITVPQAQEAYRIVAAATDVEALQTITAKALGLEAPVPTVYQGAGTQKALAAVAPDVVERELIAASNLTRKRDEAARNLVAAEKARPMVALLRREMLKGHDLAELANTLKHAFQSTDLDTAKPYLEPLLREAGLYGVIYSTQDSFTDCREGADFLATHNPGVKGIVAGHKCSGCVYSKMSRCLMYGKPLVKEASDLYTSEMVEKVALEYRTAGLYRADHNIGDEPQTNREKLAALHTEARAQIHRQRMTPAQRMAQSLAQGHMMNRSDTGGQTSSLTKRDIVKTARRFLNEGLYGQDLLAALKSRFDVRSLTASTSDLRAVIAEQGLQGIHYVDPTVYDDYGKGCREAASLHRSRLVPYLKQGAKCGSCVHQSKPGHCSVINKSLVEEPPYIDKTAQQREVLASGNSVEVSYESLMNNGLTMMAEYQLQHGGFDVEVDDVKVAETLGVQFGQAGQGVRL